ncbi:MAG TPA: amidohydrolase family protein [Candidatus Fournierella merdigallinarum]|nr:amidohydrolase family protein [Candidatus Fournierella merdigallinarum]
MVTILQHGKLIDGLADRPVEDGMLIFEGSKILYAGPFCPEAAAKYPGVQALDVRDKTIMPGLIDAHVHLTMYGKPSSVMDFLMDSATYTALKAADCAKKLLYAGFTTVRSMGDKASADYAVKRAINEGMIQGPRLLTSGKAISITGGHGDFVPGDVELDSIGETCDGVDQVRRAARDRLKNGADNIKLMATGGGNSPGPGTVSQLTEEEMRVAVEEAANRNALTAAHAIGADGIKRALRAGVRTIEHASFLDDEGIELLLKGDHYLVPTLCAFRTIKYGPEGGVPDYVLEKIHYFATAHYAGLEKAYKAGVKIVCGTDTGTPFNCHGDGAEELEMYTKLCMTPMEAIKTATSMAAQALRQPDIGVLAAGKTADLLVVDGDVLANIALLQDKSKLAIYHNGLAVNNT